jgi:RHS repeat-associated protein
MVNLTLTPHSIFEERAYYLQYDVTGKITWIYSNLAITTLVESYTYDEDGNRVKTVNAAGTTYYVYDASGNVLGIYTGTTPALTEIPVYGSSRLGTYFVTANNYVYEIRDNVGSVRVAINATRVSGQADIYKYDDYYPFGSVTQSGGSAYRYDYQGAYSEKDAQTTYNNFNLRMYDGRIGRWLSTDPAGQFASPYEGMGNNPVSGNDPTGGDDEAVSSPIYDKVTGAFLGLDSQGFSGDILYGDQISYNILSNNGDQTIDHGIAVCVCTKTTTLKRANIRSLV